MKRSLRESVCESRSFLLVATLLLVCWTSQGAAQQFPADGKELSIDSPGVQLVRQGNLLFVGVDAQPADRTITIPRIYASLVSVHFLDQAPHKDLNVHPEPSEWLIRWSPEVNFQKVVVLEFDGPPWLDNEIMPAEQAGDGTVTLHACTATTSGEKLRYEPQPHKNTVGYWTIPTDIASWKMRIQRAGEFNVGILQGCGKGQGGSDAELVLSSEQGPAIKLDFSTVETGHFQNFIWRNLGKVQVDQPGDYTLVIRPKKIAKGALMDVRMIHLSPAR